MSIAGQKITEDEIRLINVKSTPGSRLHGTVQENKNVFDKLPEFIAGKINGLITAVINEGAGEILIKNKDGKLVPLGEIIGNPDDMTVTVGGSEITVQAFIDKLVGDFNAERDSDRVTTLNGLHNKVAIADAGNDSIHIETDPATGRILLTAIAAYQPIHAFTHKPGGTDTLTNMLYYKRCRL